MASPALAEGRENRKGFYGGVWGKTNYQKGKKK